MCQWDLTISGHSWQMFMLSGNSTNLIKIRKENALPNMIDFGEIILTLMVWVWYRYEFVERDVPLADNDATHESLLHMQDVNENEGIISCVLYVKTNGIMTPFLCSTSGTLLPL